MPPDPGSRTSSAGSRRLNRDAPRAPRQGQPYRRARNSGTGRRPICSRTTTSASSSSILTRTISALIGTTDIPIEGSAEDVAIDDDEIDYLLRVRQPLFQARARAGPTSCTPFPACARSMTTTPRTRPRSRATTSSIEPERGDRPRAAAVGVRRQDHHLPQAGRARAGPTRAVLPAAWAAPGRRARRCPAATCRTPISTLSRADLARALSVAARDAAHALCPALRNARRDLLGGARSLADLGRHFGGALYEREARYLREIEWAQTAEDILSAARSTACILTGRRAMTSQIGCRRRDDDSRSFRSCIRRAQVHGKVLCHR